jgi:teichuronic acid biosynthesis protein TuaE
MRLTIPRKIPVLKTYALLLWATSLIGTHFLSLDAGIKLSLYRILILCAPFFFLFLQKKHWNNITQNTNYVYFQFLVFWLLYSILCLVFVNDFLAWGNSFLFLLCGVIASWFIGMCFDTEKDFVRLFKIVEIFTLFVIATCFYEILTMNYLFVSDTEVIEPLNRAGRQSSLNLNPPVSIFGNPNNIAFFMVFSFFVSLALTIMKKSVLGKYFSLSVCAVLAFLLITTQSRSSFIGLSIGLFIMFIIYFWNLSLNKKVKLFFVCIFCLLLIGWWLGHYKDVFSALVEFNVEQQGGSDDIRTSLIKNGLIILKNKYFLGTGLGNIEYNMLSHTGTYGIINIHNWWFEILVSSGVIIFFLYVFIYLRNIALLYRASKVNDKKVAFVSKCMLGYFVAFIVTSMGPSTCMGIEWMWPSVAILMVFTNVLRQRKQCL